LITASHFTKVVGIYNLEGCIQQGFLSKLKNFDWDQKVTITANSLNKVAHFRRLVSLAIWILSYWIYVAIVIMLFISWIIWLLRKRRVKMRRGATHH
jgi:hypothetical protein